MDQQSIASVLAQHNLQESLLILKRLSGEGLWYVLHVEELPMYQRVVWVERKKFNLIWDFGSSGSDSCFFLFSDELFPFILSTFSDSFFLLKLLIASESVGLT